MAEAKALSNLQTLNWALATGFIVTCGDAVQAIYDAWNIPEKGNAGWFNVALLILLVSIGAKVAFDDHRALERGKIQPFFAVDSTALVVTYSIIISSTALVVNFYLSTLLLAVYILALGLWNSAIFLILCFESDSQRHVAAFREASGLRRTVTWFRCLRAEEFESKRVIGWLVLDVSGAALVALFTLARSGPEIVLGLVLLFLVVDLLISDSFGSLND